MTGFASLSEKIGERLYKVEIRSLNHRFLDVKCRIPREFSSREIEIRNLLKKSLTRGSIEIKIESISDPDQTDPDYAINLSLAAHYFEQLNALRRTIGIKDPVRSEEIFSFPDVISKRNDSIDSKSEDEKWKPILELTKNCIGSLIEMRKSEGSALKETLMQSISTLKAELKKIDSRRDECMSNYRDSVADKIRAVFEAHPLSTDNTQALLEARISQELALIMDRTDVQEELTRFGGHLDHFEKIIERESPVGRKLEFVLQELNREINTLGNKAQDLQISEEVVQVKTRLEQMREQVMNVE